MRRLILALNLASALVAFGAAYFSFRAADGDLPPMRSYFDAAPPDDPFTLAVQSGARDARIAAVLAGVAGVVAIGAVLAQHRDR
jgi:hypothetical protein